MKKIILLSIFLCFLLNINAQKKKSQKYDLKSSQLSGLEFRSIGPAFMSGRIADIAINSENEIAMSDKSSISLPDKIID